MIRPEPHYLSDMRHTITWQLHVTCGGQTVTLPLPAQAFGTDQRPSQTPAEWAAETLTRANATHERASGMFGTATHTTTVPGVTYTRTAALVQWTAAQIHDITASVASR